MADPIQTDLKTPPRSTGDIQRDFVLLQDWVWEIYQKVQESISYINSQVSNPEVSFENLPDPETATIASAQTTANQAYALANDQKNRIDRFFSGEVVIDETNDTATVTFTDDQVQADNQYSVFVQAKAISGSPDPDAFIIRTKTYTENDFTITIQAAPGVGASITFEWQLIRNT